MSSSLVDILLHLVGVSREHGNTVYGSRFPHSLPRTREEKILHDYVQRFSGSHGSAKRCRWEV